MDRHTGSISPTYTNGVFEDKMSCHLDKRWQAKTYSLNVDNGSFTWTLDDFSRLINHKDADECVESPLFECNYKMVCCIQLYNLNGETDYLSARVCCKKFNDDVMKAPATPEKYKLYLSILKNSGVKHVEREITIYTPQVFYSEYYISDIIQKKAITSPDSDLIINDSIKLRFDFETLFKEINVSSNLRLTLCEKEEFSFSMKKQFLETQFSDVKFVTADGKELPAHKIILVSRVPYFERMFQSNMKESATNVVEITDIEFDVFKEMLRFVYTGSVEDIGAVAMDLIKAADRYGIDTLKNKCGDHLCEAITLENVMSIMLEVAIPYDVQYLTRRALLFIKQDLNKKVIMNDDYRNDFNHPTMDFIERRLPILVDFLKTGQERLAFLF